MSLRGLGALLVVTGCSNGFAPADVDRSMSANRQQAAAEVPPPGPGDPRAVIVALGGPNTKGFVTGEPFGAPLPAVEAALQAFGASLRQFASDHQVAILGTSRFGPNSLVDGDASDELILDALRAGAVASGRPGLVGAPILLYGISGGSPEAAGFTARHPARVAGLFLKVPVVAPAMTTEAQRHVPVMIAQAELDVFVDNAAVAAAFASGRANGALWALGREGGVPHHAVTPVHQQATLAWMDGVLERRLAGASARIRSSVPQSGWLGDPATGAVTPWGAYSGDRAAASWLPTRNAAEAWSALAGF
jgi:hypothetical protein